MKVISLYQPYASLVVIGAKQFETRSWDTHYRGPLLIHATKSMPAWCEELIFQEPFKSTLWDPYAYDGFPKGAIIGQGELVSTTKTTLIENKWQREVGFNDMPNEWHFGDYSAGRFAW